MIAVSKKGFLFGGKSDEVWAKTFWCMVSTAKEGITKGYSTVIFRIHGSGTQRKNYEPLAKILYVDSASKQDRLKLHDAIVSFINENADAKEAPDLQDILLRLNGQFPAQDKVAHFVHPDP